MLTRISEKPLEMVHERDPRQAIMDQLGDLSGLELMLNNVLVVVYQRAKTANKTAGGIFLPDKTKEEDKWQGIVGLVVAKGPKAYQDDEVTKFDGENVEIGDWVWFRPAEGTLCVVNKVLCRVFGSERGIIAKITHPDYVF